MNIFRIISILMLLCFAAISPASSIFETFATDATSRGWLDSGNSWSVFDHNTAGWLNAKIARNSSAPGRYYINLGRTYDQTAEFWTEMDVLYISTSDPYQQCLFGVFGTNADNNHNVIADRFFYDSYNGVFRGNRNDVVVYDSAGIKSEELSAPDRPGIPYGTPARVQMHYWYSSGVGKATLKVSSIKANGSTGDLIMSAGPVTILLSGKTVQFSRFGLANRTDNNTGGFNCILVDNLYFSDSMANPNPDVPSFMVYKAGDFDKDGDVDFPDLSEFTGQWLNLCNSSWCEGADFDHSGRVQLADYAKFSGNWLYQIEPNIPTSLNSFIAVYDSEANSPLVNLFTRNGMMAVQKSTQDMYSLCSSLPGLLVIGQATKFPPLAREELARYLSYGGNMMVLDPTAFDYNPQTYGHVLIADFNSGPAGYTVSKPSDPRPEKQVLTKFVSASGQSWQGIEITTPEIGLGDIFINIPLSSYRSADNCVVCFWGKGDYEVDIITLQLTDTAGKQYVAFVNATDEWQYYEIPFANFLQMGIAGITQVSPGSVQTLSIGLSKKILWADKGGDFCIGQVRLAKTHAYAGIMSQELRRWRIPLERFGITYPEYIISPFLDSRQMTGCTSIESTPGQSVATGITLGVTQGIWNVPAYEINAKSNTYSGTDNELLDELERDSMRRIRLLTARDSSGKVLGTAAEFRFHTGGLFCGASMALFGMTNMDYSANSRISSVVISTAKYMLNVPKIVRVRTYTTAVKTDPNIYQCELQIDNPTPDKKTVAVNVSVANGLLSGSKQVSLAASTTTTTAVTLGQISASFPITNFGWNATVTSGSVSDSMSDVVNVEKSLIKVCKNILHLISTNADGRISNHFFADIYGVRAIYALGLHLQDPVVLARNADVLAGSTANDFINAAYRWCDMVSACQYSDGSLPIGYSDMKGLRWVADNGSVALGFAQLASWVEAARSQTYRVTAENYFNWRETFYISPEKSVLLRQQYPGAVYLPYTVAGNYGLGYMDSDFITGQDWPEIRREERGPEYVLGCSMAAGGALSKVSSSPAIYQNTILRDSSHFIDANCSAASYFQAEALMWMYYCLGDADVKQQVLERFKNTFLGSCINDDRHPWFGVGGRKSLNWLSLTYYYRVFENSPRIRAAMLRAIWELCSESSSYSMSTVAEKYTHTSHGSSAAASKYAGSCSAVWLMELIKPGSTLIKNQSFNP